MITVDRALVFDDNEVFVRFSDGYSLVVSGDATSVTVLHPDATHTRHLTAYTPHAHAIRARVSVALQFRSRCADGLAIDKPFWTGQTFKSPIHFQTARWPTLESGLRALLHRQSASSSSVSDGDDAPHFTCAADGTVSVYSMDRATCVMVSPLGPATTTTTAPADAAATTGTDTGDAATPQRKIDGCVLPQWVRVMYPAPLHKAIDTVDADRTVPLRAYGSATTTTGTAAVPVPTLTYTYTYAVVHSIFPLRRYPRRWEYPVTLALQYHAALICMRIDKLLPELSAAVAPATPASEPAAAELKSGISPTVIAPPHDSTLFAAAKSVPAAATASSASLSASTTTAALAATAVAPSAAVPPVVHYDVVTSLPTTLPLEPTGAMGTTTAGGLPAVERTPSWTIASTRSLHVLHALSPASTTGGGAAGGTSASSAAYHNTHGNALAPADKRIAVEWTADAMYVCGLPTFTPAMAAANDPLSVARAGAVATDLYVAPEQARAQELERAARGPGSVQVLLHADDSTLSYRSDGFWEHTLNPTPATTATAAAFAFRADLTTAAAVSAISGSLTASPATSSTAAAPAAASSSASSADSSAKASSATSGSAAATAQLLGAAASSTAVGHVPAVLPFASLWRRQYLCTAVPVKFNAAGDPNYATYALAPVCAHAYQLLAATAALDRAKAVDVRLDPPLSLVNGFSDAVHESAEVSGSGQYTSFADRRVRVRFVDRTLLELSADHTIATLTLAQTGRRVRVHTSEHTPPECVPYVRMALQFAAYTFLSEQQRIELRRRELEVERRARFHIQLVEWEQSKRDFLDQLRTGTLVGSTASGKENAAPAATLAANTANTSTNSYKPSGAVSANTSTLGRSSNAITSVQAPAKPAADHVVLQQFFAVANRTSEERARDSEWSKSVDERLASVRRLLAATTNPAKATSPAPAAAAAAPTATSKPVAMTAAPVKPVSPPPAPRAASPPRTASSVAIASERTEPDAIAVARRVASSVVPSDDNAPPVRTATVGTPHTPGAAGASHADHKHTPAPVPAPAPVAVPAPAAAAPAVPASATASPSKAPASVAALQLSVAMHAATANSAATMAAAQRNRERIAAIAGAMRASMSGDDDLGEGELRADRTAPIADASARPRGSPVKRGTPKRGNGGTPSSSLPGSAAASPHKKKQQSTPSRTRTAAAAGVAREDSHQSSY